MSKHQPNMNDHWKLRLVAATRGNSTMFGAVILAIFNHQPNRRPFIKGLAYIDGQGVIHAKLYSKSLLLGRVVPLFHVKDFNDELARVAEMCKMDTREAAEFLSEARKWIERDLRAKSTLE